MKKLILAIALLTSIQFAFACDICGGGLGANYLGLLPNFNKKFIGLRYHFNQLNTQLDIDGNRTALSNAEKYRTVDIWGAWNFGSKLRAMAILPYSHIEKYNPGADATQSKNGIGDISLTGFYNLWNSNNTIHDKKLVQSIWIGTGVKLATGTYNTTTQVQLYSPNIYQLGSGSYDMLTFLNYDIRLQDMGLNISTNYKINTENKDKYRYGNKFIGNINLYHKFSISENIMVSPNIGLAYENQSKDHNTGYKINETGGNNSNALLGVEANIGKVAFGATYQTPIAQDINNGRTELKQKISTHLTFTF